MGKRDRLRAVEQMENPRESIKVKNIEIKNDTVYMAMGDLLKGYYSQSCAYQLEKLSRRLNQLNKAFADASEAIIKKYAELDKKGQPTKKMEASIDAEGKPILNNDGTPKMVPVDFIWRKITSKNEAGEEVTDDGKDLAAIEFEALGEEVNEIDVYKFQRAEFAQSKLTVVQWMSLDWLFTEPYMTEEAKKE